jgi:methylenetetrahydrofolate reductase (NADPH)
MTKKLGVTVPIIPGLLPVLSAHQTKKFTALCGAALPAAFSHRLEELAADDAAVTAYGIEYATKQAEALLRFGVAGLHFYTLNKSHSTLAVVDNLGLRK